MVFTMHALIFEKTRQNMTTCVRNKGTFREKFDVTDDHSKL